MLCLLFASNNPGKVMEIRALLGDLPIEIVTPEALGLDLEVQEAGNSYAENAALKAVEYLRRTNLLSLADDSGLEVQALGGLPGIRSRRFSPKPGASDADRRKILLEHLQTSPRPWAARFCCVLALAGLNRQVEYTEGECRGEIIPVERGTHGFGYDPIFLFPELNRTMAELDLEEKNQVSHRARAMKKMVPILEKYL